MIKYDYHLHTNYSSDSAADMEDVIKRAVSLGLEEIIFTDHWDYVYPDKYFPYQINYNDYIINLDRLKYLYKDKIRIILGVEIGIGPHLGPAVSKFVSKYNFDFVIGSIHDINGKDLYLDNYFDGLTKEDAYNGYFNYFVDSVRAVADINVLGHIDYASRYGNFEDPEVRYDEYSEIIDILLKETISRGKGIEINTSGFRYGINNVYPQMKILKKYKEFGGEIITVGSDAHKACDVAKDFDKAYAILKEAGFSYITLFRNRKPEFVKI